MAEEKGYWFTTDTGVHVHVEPGESKEEALARRFPDSKKKLFEPAGGFETQVDHVKKVGGFGWEEYKPIKTEYGYKGDKGSYDEMISKYGRSIDDVKNSHPKTYNDKRLKDIVNKNNDISTGDANHYNNIIYGKSREKTVNTKPTDNPTYKSVVYNRNNKEIATLDSTGNYTGLLNHGMQSYDWRAHHGDNSRHELAYSERYNKGANFKQPDWMEGLPRNDWKLKEMRKANRENRRNIK